MKKYLLLIAVLITIALIANFKKHDTADTEEQSRNSANAHVLGRIDGEPINDAALTENNKPTRALTDKESNAALAHSATAGTKNDEVDSSGNYLSESHQLKEENIVIDNGQRVVLKTTELEKMSHDQINNFVESLRFSDEKNHLSFETEVSLDKVVSNLVSDKLGVSSVPAGCATSLCGVLISSESLDDVRSLLDELSNKENLGQYVNGGFLRIYDDNGVYYGLIIAGLEKGRPITIAK